MTSVATRLSAAILLLLLAPVLAGLALLIWLADRQRPVFLAERAGLHGVPFRMVKFRTMRHAVHGHSAITAVGDRRVTPLGRILRNSKVDELPQLLNIARGDMAFFGPRPEDPGIVARSYDADMRRSLDFRPGLLSPGTLWALRNVNRLDGAGDQESAYVREILPTRLAIDTAYFRSATAIDNARLVMQTAAQLLKRLTSAEARE